MRRKIRGTSVFTAFVLVVMVSAALRARAQDTKTPYPSVASLDQYLMERHAKIALAAGVPLAELLRRVGVSQQTYYRWKKQYVAPEVD